MKAFFNSFKGSRTYMVAGLIFVLGGVQALGVHVPAEVYTVLGALGLGAVRAAIGS